MIEITFGVFVRVCGPLALLVKCNATLYSSLVCMYSPRKKNDRKHESREPALSKLSLST